MLHPCCHLIQKINVAVARLRVSPGLLFEWMLTVLAGSGFAIQSVLYFLLRLN